MSFDEWAPSSGGGGPAEFILTVEDVKPESNKQDPTKQNITWNGKDHTGQARGKSFSIGKDWRFDYGLAKFVDMKGQARGVNENTTFGTLLRCMRDGQPFDLRAAAAAIGGKGSPLSPMTWIGTRWHMARVGLDFGQGVREVMWPIAFLGMVGQPMPQVNWLTPEGAQSFMQSAGQAPPPPMGQQQFLQTQSYPQQAPQGYPQQAPPAPMPVQGYQQQAPQPMQQFAQQQFQQQVPQVQQMPPQGYQQAPGYQQHGGGPAGAPPFHG